VNGLRRQRELDRAARLVPCYLRYITLAFANDLVIVAKSEREMKEMMKNLGKYLRKKKLEVRKNEENEWNWEGRKKEQLMS
jgi:chorismate-pyruvate lyase